ncbi:MAG: zf-HC2 domain-containing protein [Myxococcales bacterium]|nr:zf-HC2 domain-containing protein [Myxococcales bacterium]
MKLDREVAGLTCARVLEHLPDFIDGRLAPAERASVEAHLAGCDVCERFGGSYGAVVAALRRELGTPEPLSRDVEQRLAQALGAPASDDP